MSTDAAAQLHRLLLLIPRATGDEPLPLDALAREIGSDAETIKRDLWALGSNEDLAGYVDPVTVTLEDDRLAVRTRTLHAPRRLAPMELRALELGLELMRRETAPPRLAAVDAALALVRKLLVRRPEPVDVDAELAADQSGGDPAVLMRLREARRRLRKVRVRYAPSSGPTTARVVHPYATHFANGMWYLLGWCELREAVRAFRLDRIEDAVLLDADFARPADSITEQFVREGRVFSAAEPAPVLRVRYSAKVAPWIAERERRELAADGSLEMEHPLADPAWAVRHLLQYGAEVTVLEPDDLRAQLVAQLEALRSAP